MAAKKEQPTNVNTNNNVNNNTNVNNTTNVVNVNVPRSRKPSTKKEKKPNWVLKAIVLALIGLISSVIIIYVRNATATNGKPAYIQNGTPAIKGDNR